ncbi:class I SAM-dependent methyltransferase [Oceanirhabdus sp. W0125-5]|uniref:class I SAM-dependent methyltransferase n=1 Tax=Oceanirhabdus sp. W0125-5 TaxID=2999116 RepID=UPI0022F2B761|nr:class I SAM-dependent methyltransferase [Oceanirhabdus sp. W0125-5]WBW96909.1 class I SAM-dependent methyltransferase [Oceanirhabdus sp. W0125-5]
MKEGYKSTIEFWQKVFAQKEELTKGRDYRKEINVIDLEKGIQWISSGSEKILDYGCGNGAMIQRALAYGVDKIYGIDICENAIRQAINVVKEYHLEDKSSFQIGGVEALQKIQDCEFDGVILSNIIDNMIPEDSLRVLDEVARILKPSGKLLLKINPYIEEEKRIEWKFEELEEEFYKETTGLYLWNLTEEKINKILDEKFIIEERIEVYYEEHDMSNRMYYVRKK